ncbi:MAG TPA: orotidine-5'-phosphate decarboxylase [Stellaceae bacterium]|nr:orotidine-5'-phosphate decarboxylase [Stellaceae bacterium]
MAARNPLLVAIDTPDPARARALAAAVANVAGGIKLGLEFFTANGPAAVKEIARGAALFLDLKLHDIPNTVAGAVRAAAALEPLLLTVHAGGGPAMMRAAAEAAGAAGARRPKLLGVTVLTSLDDADLARVGQSGPAADQALRLALLARESGLDGVVCSPHEVARLRAACGQDFLLVVPGIRPAGTGADDQKRVLTPRAALDAGADYLVIGRPITAAPDPGAAARAIAAELR